MTNSYRQILRSSSIIGGASVINILVGLLRMKAAAVLLGPAGVGLIGLLTNIVATASGVAAVGVGNVGTRQVAEVTRDGDPRRVWLVRRALVSLMTGLAFSGGVIFWLLRDVLANRVLGVGELAGALGWLSIGVTLSVAAASQNALLNGMRRIGDIARVSVGSAVLSTVGGIVALWFWGEGGIVPYVLAAPVASFLIGRWYVARLPRANSIPAKLNELISQWRTMIQLGFAFMVAGLAGTAGQLIVRTLVQRELGAEALGHFQAAWGISMTYIGFVLAAMGTDYYPRLTVVIRDHAAVNKLVNEQTEVAVLLATPVLLGMLALAPWVIRLLYSSAFAEAVEVLRWQVLGDILKIISWPLGFIMLASGSGKTFMVTEWLVMLAFSALTFVLLPRVGLVATGVSFLFMYFLLLTAVWTLAVRRTGFTWSRIVRRLGALAIACGVAIHLTALLSELAAALLGAVLAAGWGVYALVRLARTSGLSGPVAKLAALAEKVMTKVGV